MNLKENNTRPQWITPARPRFFIAHCIALWYNYYMQRQQYTSYKPEVIALRKQGKTYGEIQKAIGLKIPKSTLSNWCSSVSLTYQQKLNIENKIISNINRGRMIAIEVNRIKRAAYLKSIEKKVLHLKNKLKDKDIAKIALAMLYLGEGLKRKNASIMLGNSDPEIIKLFMKLMRHCYDIDETKFRCTLQCRADQNIKKLEKFWSNITKIPLDKFYKAQIDPRTIGKKTKKTDYKGVCRIDYFSGDLFNEIIKITEILSMGL